MKKGVTIRNHTCVIDGRERILISADYPYYRDHVDLWDKKLAALKRLDIDAVTFYVPWRHHSYLERGRQVFDFTGKTLPNRNVRLFLELVAKNRLWAVVKPGPFIHAETDRGGFADWAVPGQPSSRCEAELDYRNKPRRWITGDIFPSPTGSVFLRLVEEWFRAVDRNLIKGNTYPRGPIISVQIANEGLYTDAGAEPHAFDFSASSLALYRDYCRELYGTIAEYNRLHATRHRSFAEVEPSRRLELGAKVTPAELLRHMDWRTYQNRFTETFFARLSSFLPTRSVPRVTNAALHYKPDHFFDYWVLRNSYYNLKNVHAGFTNWVGVVSCESAAFDKYLTAIKYVKGINWEENWGFSKIYDPRYIHPVVPYYQTLLAMAAGARGFNVYTGVATSNWDSHLDSKHERPYPATPPLDDQGDDAAQAPILRALNRFFKTEEKDFLACVNEARIAFLLDLHYSAAAGFEKNRFARLRHLHDGVSLRDFVHHCKETNTNFDLMNVHCEHHATLAKHDFIVLPSCFFMSRKMQRMAVTLLKDRKLVLWFGELPEFDEKMRPCTVLADFVRRKRPINLVRIGGLSPVTARRWAEVFGRLGLEPPRSRARIYYQRYVGRNARTAFVFLFSRAGRNQKVRMRIPEGRIECNLTSHSALAFKIQDGRIRSAIVKSVDEMGKNAMPVRLLLNGRGLVRKKAEDGFFVVK